MAEPHGAASWPHAERGAVCADGGAASVWRSGGAWVGFEENRREEEEERRYRGATAPPGTPEEQLLHYYTSSIFAKAPTDTRVVDEQQPQQQLYHRQFSSSSQEETPADGLKMSLAKPCYFWGRAACRNGENCRFSHDAPMGHALNATPRDGYVCKRCGVPGHWIFDCPSGGSSGKEEKSPPAALCSAIKPPSSTSASGYIPPPTDLSKEQTLYKCALCTIWKKTGGFCHFGDSCSFAHGRHELRCVWEPLTGTDGTVQCYRHKATGKVVQEPPAAWIAWKELQTELQREADEAAARKAQRRKEREEEKAATSALNGMPVFVPPPVTHLHESRFHLLSDGNGDDDGEEEGSASKEEPRLNETDEEADVPCPPTPEQEQTAVAREALERTMQNLISMEMRARYPDTASSAFAKTNAFVLKEAMKLDVVKDVQRCLEAKRSPLVDQDDEGVLLAALRCVLPSPSCNGSAGSTSTSAAHDAACHDDEEEEETEAEGRENEEEEEADDDDDGGEAISEEDAQKSRLWQKAIAGLLVRVGEKYPWMGISQTQQIITNATVIDPGVQEMFSALIATLHMPVVAEEATGRLPHLEALVGEALAWSDLCQRLFVTFCAHADAESVAEQSSMTALPDGF